jgi:hypothetical protein
VDGLVPVVSAHPVPGLAAQVVGHVVEVEPGLQVAVELDPDVREAASGVDADRASVGQLGNDPLVVPPEQRHLELLLPLRG